MIDGGAVGIPARYLVDRAVPGPLDTVFPLATFGYGTVRLAEEGADSYVVANLVIGGVAHQAPAYSGVCLEQWVRS